MRGKKVFVTFNDKVIEGNFRIVRNYLEEKATIHMKEDLS